MGSDLDPETSISSSPAAERSLVAIGRALAIKSDILVLDEPTAALPEADVERLLETLRRAPATSELSMSLIAWTRSCGSQIE